MTNLTTIKSNLLGDVRAENDHAMLDSAFHEWQDYKSLLEADDRFVVVGRRGTGKSALTYRLKKEFEAKKYFVVVVAPNEEEFIGLRAITQKYGHTVQRVRSAIKLGWRYALIMEISTQLSHYYKSSALIESSRLNKYTKEWCLGGSSIISRLKSLLRSAIRSNESPEEAISELTTRLHLEEVTNLLSDVLEKLGKKVVVLVDRLDEGYEADDIGIGIVDGIIYGTDDLRLRFEVVKAVLFLRDNIFRAIQQSDQDFSRNIEGSVLRLHWDPQELFYLICKRMRSAFNVKVESDVKLWNQYTEPALHGREGFRKCLQLTLYRPRDIVALLNNAFQSAKKNNRDEISNDDLQASSKYISNVRYDDLGKEYSSVFPGITFLTKAFSGESSRISIDKAREIVGKVIQRQDLEPQVIQHLRLFDSPDEVLKALYAVGFLGLLDSSGNFVFCHDGSKQEKFFSDASTLLIHPCYWTALDIKSEVLNAEDAQEIYDEYEITIASQSKEIRDKMIGRIISELKDIDLGDEDAHAFEDWCKRVLELLFAGQLINLQLRPNSNATSRRDIVATNEGLKGFWQRILSDYGTRQVVFEVKNYEKLTVSEYRQVYSYLGKEYGKCGFIICRDKMKELTKGSDLDAFREFYTKEMMIIKLTANSIVSMLNKLRSPQKFDVANDMLTKHIDDHIRLYANGQTNSHKKKGN